jgi:hypothetical protein
MAFRPVVTRSGLVLGIAATLAVALAVGGTPAGAAQAATTTRTAVASWTPTATGSPNVSLQITEQSGPLSSYTFFFVNENYCDSATNTAVFLSYEASGPTNNQLFVVTPNLSAAVLAAPKLSVNFTEQTAPECNTNGSDLTTVVSGPRNVSLFGLWHATGPATTTFPGETVRPASATVLTSAPAPLTLANLGAPSFAQINQYTTS